MVPLRVGSLMHNEAEAENSICGAGLRLGHGRIPQFITAAAHTAAFWGQLPMQQHV